jgi:hypothetical protein
MAIKTFKEIIANKGYRIDSNDRKIFEMGTIESFFGLSPNDAIEFIIYDSNDNQLPQQNFSNVRYIPLTAENIGDYFLIAEGTLFQKYKFPNEYFIDIERLLKEAGYTNGIFKTQITLINKRVGSEKALDKLWISEISPSRTEIRLFPNNKGVGINPQLKERFNLLMRDGNFREDVAKFSLSFVENISPAKIGTLLTAKYSQQWFDKFRAEYKIQDFDLFCNQIHNKFLESCINEFSNRISDVNDINYGKQKGIAPPIALDIEHVKLLVSHLLVNTLNKYLSIPDVRYGSKKLTKLQSEDTAADILQTKTSDTMVDTKSPVLNKVVKKTAGQSQQSLALEKQIQKEIEDRPMPDVITPDDRPNYKRFVGGGSRNYSPIDENMPGRFNNEQIAQNFNQQNYL